MELVKILQDVEVEETWGNQGVKISQIAFDSREITENALFVAISGTNVDGHQFIEKAIEKGAVAIIAERLPEKKSTDILYLRVADSALALGKLAATFYGHPSRQLKLIGVTGTNGKTTTVTLLYDLFTEMGYRSGLLSTIENRMGELVLPTSHTTPDVLTINRLLAEMLEMGCDYVFMEVSSHAVDQKRIAGLDFSGAIFTNITHDHLDYHKTFRAYIDAKKSFFDQLPKSAFALTNIDDKRGLVMVQNTQAKVYRYSLRKTADFKVKIVENGLTGLHLEINKREFYGRLIGEFNAYNLLAVYATAVLLGQEEIEVLTILSQIKAAEGRFDYLVEP